MIERGFLLQLLKNIHIELVRLGEIHSAVRIEFLHKELLTSDSIRTPLEDFARTPGFEVFATRLMWLADFIRVDGSLPNHAVAEYEKQCLIASLPGRKFETEALAERDCTYVSSLHEFGRLVEVMKRRAAESDSEEFSPELLFRLETIAVELEKSAQVSSKQKIAILMKRFAVFVRWVRQNQEADLSKVLSVIATTNLTLQTAEQLGYREYDDVIEQTSRLVGNADEICVSYQKRLREVL